MKEEAAPVNGHQPLELAGGAKVCGLDEEEDHDEGHDGDEDVGRDEAQDEDQPNHDEQLVEDVLEVDGEGRVYFIDVPGQKELCLEAVIYLENLFTILPVGVVSKKLIGARRMFLRRLLWSCLEALMVPKVITMMARKMKRLWRPPSTP